MTDKDYNHCVDTHADSLYRFILKNIKNVSDAQDIVQNAFEVLWNQHREINREKSKAYLFKVAYNNMIDIIRKNKRLDYPEEVPGNEAINAHHEVDTMEIIDVALNKLPEIQKTVVLLRDYEGYDYKEIGNITGLNESQVKVYIFRARKTLRQYIGSIENVL